MNKVGTVIRVGIGVLCCVLLGLSIYRVAAANQEYAKEKQQHKELVEKYKPKEIPAETTSGVPAGEETKQVVNQGIIDLQSVNPDVVGWITVPDTYIDYPFVWAADYDEYLRADMYKQESVSGAIFMDYRLDKEMEGFYSILYGHNMDNGSMFGDLIKFRDREFYQNHKQARMNLPNKNIELELISCVVVDSTDEDLYGMKESDVKKQNFLTYLKTQSIHGDTMVPDDLAITDRFIALSTCSYDYTEARTVVVFRMVEG